MQFEFDHYSFEQTAKALWTINPTVRAKFDDEAGLVTYMESETRREMTQPGFWGTAGFYVAASWKHSDPATGTLYCAAHVQAHAVLCYIKAVQAAANGEGAR